ncbi:MAG: hypothetical protein V1787_04195 [Candidatus Micrarchaeota archaeon]
MDLRLMIKEMIQQGMSDEEIVANLKELGIQDVEKAIADALAEDEKGAPKARAQAPQQKIETPIEEAGEGPEEPEVEGLESSKSLFEEPAEKEEAEDKEEPVKQLFEETPKPAPHERRKAEAAVEDIPKLEITKIEAGEEKTTDIAAMLNKAGIESVVQPVAQTRLADIGGVERKLDDLLAAIKALQSIDKQILEANREMLFKLKVQK